MGLCSSVPPRDSRRRFITRLTIAWKEEQQRFQSPGLYKGVDYVYIWVDGVHFNVRLEENRPVRPGRRRRPGRRLEGTGVHQRRPAGVHRELGRREDADQLLAFFDFPTEHWIHPKTTNPDRVHLRHGPLEDQVTKGPGSKAAGLAMAYKLIEAAQDRWRGVNGAHLVALVRASAIIEKGVLIERSNHDTPEVAA